MSKIAASKERNKTMLVSAPVSMKEAIESLISKLGLEVKNRESRHSLTDEGLVVYMTIDCDGICPEQLRIPGVKVNMA